MSRSEEINNYKINLFDSGNNELVPIRVSKKCDTDFDLDFMFLEDGPTHHYVLITNLKNLICCGNGRSLSSGDCPCRNCFPVCPSKEICGSHIVSCFNNEPALIQMPKPQEKNEVHEQ